LDIGDVWTGVAISDPAGITARPLTTLHSTNLLEQIKELVTAQKVTKIIIGYPQTVRGTESAQTKKVVQVAHEIETLLVPIPCILLDERFTSQQAASLSKKKIKTKEDKHKEHAVAAALILKSYLDHLYFSSLAATDE
jgi:putative Holliday junction resolvase